MDMKNKTYECFYLIKIYGFIAFIELIAMMKREKWRKKGVKTKQLWNDTFPDTKYFVCPHTKHKIDSFL